jgi:hypothetical protein
MPVREFPALGFDPAPGEPAVLDALGSDVARHARSLASSSQRIATIRATGWVGQAADAFAAGIAPLPGDLGRSADAFGMVASALDTYAGELDTAQRHANSLEQRAAQARSSQQLATARVDILRHGPDGETDPARTARETDLRAARLRAEDADAELAAILREAKGLAEHAFGVAEQTSRQIRAAAEQAPYREPNLVQQGLDLLQRGWETTKEWVREHADVLRTVSTALKAIAAAAALLALAVQFIPVIGQVVGAGLLAVSAVAGAGALGIDVLLKLSTGEGSWAMLGLDFALTVIPGAAITRAGKALLRPVGRALGALAKTPIVVRLAQPVAATIRQAGRAVPGIARTVRDELATLGRRLATDDRGSIRLGGRSPLGMPHHDELFGTARRSDPDFQVPALKGKEIPAERVQLRQIASDDIGRVVNADPNALDPVQQRMQLDYRKHLTAADGRTPPPDEAVADRLQALRDEGSRLTAKGEAPVNGKFAGQRVFFRDAEVAAAYPDGVYYNLHGYPDFTPYAKHEIDLPTTGDRDLDIRLANKAFENSGDSLWNGVRPGKTPPGLTWHHVEDGRTMQLVPRKVHSSASHTGGIGTQQPQASG